MKRRAFVKTSALGLTGLAFACNQIEKSQTSPSPIAVPITKGEKQHWFGYYDKYQIDPTGRYALGCEVDTFFRSPTPQDVLRIGLIDLQNDFKWREIGQSTSWGWQQGCMLQWIPGSSEEIIWNDHGKEGEPVFVSRIFNIKNGQIRTLPRPIYTLSPKGDFALTVDFDRLQFFRPGYGYPNPQPITLWEKTPEDTGVYKMNLQTGDSELIISYAQIASITRSQGSVSDNFHWFNHLLINPSGDRFIFLNRSRPVASYEEMTTYLKEHPEYKRGKFSAHYVTRAFTAGTDGSDVFALNDSGQFSHFIWKGDKEICAWAVPDDSDIAAFYDFKDHTKEYATVDHNAMPKNGHNTYVPNTDYEWILNDTYPQGDQRLQQLYLYHIPSKKKIILGEFHEPEQFKGEWRCDLHPRCDQTGQRVFFDSTHMDQKRQMYMIEIAHLL